MSKTPDIAVGSLATSAWANEIRDRTRQVFADAAERDTAWPSAPDGAHCITLDDGAGWSREGGVWVGEVAGPAGPTGPTGPTGPEGPTGPTGPGIQVEGSVPDAPTGLPPSGNPGDIWISADDGHGWMWDGTQWVDIGPLQGPPGPTGPTGPSGPPGTSTGGNGGSGGPGTGWFWFWVWRAAQGVAATAGVIITDNDANPLAATTLYINSTSMGVGGSQAGGEDDPTVSFFGEEMSVVDSGWCIYLSKGASWIRYEVTGLGSVDAATGAYIFPVTLVENVGTVFADLTEIRVAFERGASTTTAPPFPTTPTTPVIDSITPNQGPIGTTVTVTADPSGLFMEGAKLYFDTASTSSVEAPVTLVDSMTLTGTVPTTAAAGVGFVQVHNPQGVPTYSNTLPFTVT